ncbi:MULTISPECIES: hypothetical protein [Pseudomonas]|uniref:Uncharacterized protein n=1 Tax=Pseudomonas luteola TaxID=47886 RepID=A0A2X2DAK8_PSELU|nr:MULTISPECIES: hypothetical protein [Pseudomonas]ENA28261.1 hypothetical protein HMPREF1487_08837 [Pseudomonas sp. HPB0071]MBF8641347.1 hypothetical protein [Pseudomonas zeshuii]RRW50008.1 hypothetical protein EGJ50_04215 [Pseudomonas luteola]SHJ01405.1 hypothetical protein SAMN05216295_106104 [Pseudomonas zeshuii]SPZ16404.1 Uncharacterised protein [Pseudomonas luteola]
MNFLDIKEKIEADSFYESIFVDRDWNTALDARDHEEFESAWSSAFKEIRTINPDENFEFSSLREIAFKNTFKLTQNSELAGYASDDIGLISEAAFNKIENHFIERLWASYMAGIFPTHPLFDL